MGFKLEEKGLNSLKKELSILILIFGLNLFLTLNLTPLFDLDEGAFSEATREMLLRGDFITTYLEGHLRFDKPILIYWLQALLVSIFGPESWAFRLPSAIATTLWGLTIYLFTTAQWGRKRGFWATFIFITSLQIGLIGKAAIADALLNLWLAVAGFSLFLYLETRRERWLLFTFTGIGAGFLTKGPVAILIPLATFFLWTLKSREWSFFWRSIFNWKGILLFSIIALPWYIAEYLAQRWNFIVGFFLKHNLQRFETSFESHAGSIFYYIPVVLVGLLPWTTLLLRYLWNLKTHLTTRFGLFATLWFSFVFFFFSLSGTKLPHYLIYGYTPLFPLLALELERCKSEFLLSLPMLLFLTLLFFLPFVARALLPTLQDQWVKVAILTLLPYFNSLYFGVIGGLIGVTLLPIGLHRKGILLGVASVVVLNYILWIYAHFIQFPIRDVAHYLKRHQITQLVSWRLNTPSLSVYSGIIYQRRDPQPGDILLTKVTELKNLPGFKPLLLKGGVALVEVTGKKRETPFHYRKDRRE
ncbi:MAG: glycosyltransferase family 39 protein [Campylobacterales bacterium]